MGNRQKNTQDPYLARQLSVFPPGGSHQRVKLVRAPLSKWLCKKRHKDLSWFGQEKALLLVGG